jgi:negative regulator of sigma E activity
VWAPALGEMIRTCIGWAGWVLDFAVLVLAAGVTWAAAVLLVLEELEPPHPATSAASATAANAIQLSRRVHPVLIVSEKDATIRGFLPR